MNNDVMIWEDVQTQVNAIQQVMKHVMKNDTHYGKVPGCGDKPTLLKPGAEKIMLTFKLACNPDVEDLSTPDEIRFRVKTNLTARDGSFVGSGIGECSTNEEKYKWRRAVCKEEFEEAPENKKRNKWSSWQGNSKQTMQVRTNPSDLANTVLKMAKKRSLVDGVLTATAASDCFVQDIEDLPKEYVDGMGDEKASTKPNVAMPEKKETTNKEEGDEYSQDELLVCSECQEEIKKNVYDYSIGKFGKPLCFSCQKGK